MAEYPKGRGNHFAHKAIRVMTKRVVAQEYGPEVFTLLTVVAMQEDSKRYSGAVTYWNENLSALAGFANSKAMDRARRRAVESGWLVYIPGTNRRPGKYWIQIPPQHINTPDGPTDDSDAEMAECQTSKTTNEVGTEPGLKWELNRERSGNRTGNEVGVDVGNEVGTFLTLPSSSPESNSPLSAAQTSPTGGVPSAEQKKPAVTTEQVERIYAAYPRKAGHGAAVKKIEAALRGGKVSFDELLEAVQAYAAATKGAELSLLPHPVTWFNQERWTDDRDEWKRAGRGKGKGSAGDRCGGAVYRPEAAGTETEF